MKKLYMEPELELVTLKLTSDVLIASYEDNLPSDWSGGDFEVPTFNPEDEII